MNELEYLLHSENREKAIIARGAKYRASKSPKYGRMVLPSEFLSGEAKKNYSGAGRIVKWNMYLDEMMTKQEFDRLSFENKVAKLIDYRERFKTKDIKDKWGLDNYTYYKLLDELGIERTTTKPKTKVNPVEASTEEVAATVQPVEPAKPIKLPVQVVPLLKQNGMRFAYASDSATAQEAMNKLNKAKLLLEDEPGKFSIKIEIAEIEEN